MPVLLQVVTAECFSGLMGGDAVISTAVLLHLLPDLTPRSASPLMTADLPASLQLRFPPPLQAFFVVSSDPRTKRTRATEDLRPVEDGRLLVNCKDCMIFR